MNQPPQNMPHSGPQHFPPMDNGPRFHSKSITVLLVNDLIVLVFPHIDLFLHKVTNTN